MEKVGYFAKEQQLTSPNMQKKVNAKLQHYNLIVQ
jgi:hypothetical protein